MRVLTKIFIFKFKIAVSSKYWSIWNLNSRSEKDFSNPKLTPKRDQKNKEKKPKGPSEGASSEEEMRKEKTDQLHKFHILYSRTGCAGYHELMRNLYYTLCEMSFLIHGDGGCYCCETSESFMARVYLSLCGSGYLRLFFNSSHFLLRTISNIFAI